MSLPSPITPFNHSSNNSDDFPSCGGRNRCMSQAGFRGFHESRGESRSDVHEESEAFSAGAVRRCGGRGGEDKGEDPMKKKLGGLLLCAALGGCVSTEGDDHQSQFMSHVGPGGGPVACGPGGCGSMPSQGRAL